MADEALPYQPIPGIQSLSTLSTQLLADEVLIPVPRKSVTLPSGVEYFDVNEGEGTAAEEGRTVQLLWVLRRSNGYFVDASSNYDNEPYIYKVGSKKTIKGVDEGIRGMKAGGVRRMNIPPKMAFVEGVEDGKSVVVVVVVVSIYILFGTPL
ncbi:hypothetical protein B484DRAFT_327812 [Ochromonadaceae sp. CCMP2298]|nr:hypothetical protein B484DRAFT_327812 [Ochromonadaceae sp. CCMP2298]